MEPLRRRHRRALMGELRADLDIPADDDARSNEWEEIKRALLEEAHAGA